MAPTPEKVEKLRELNVTYTFLYNNVMEYDWRLATLNIMKTPMGFANLISDYEGSSSNIGKILKYELRSKILDLHRKVMVYRIPMPAELIARGVPVYQVQGIPA